MNHPGPPPGLPPVPPLTAAEIRRADKAAKRPDGTIDPFRFMAEIAAPLNLGAPVATPKPQPRRARLKKAG